MSLVAYSISQGPIGQSIWQFSGVSAPQQFMPLLKATTAVNASRTSTKYSVAVEYPLMSTVNGQDVYSGNTLRAHFDFSALRNVIADTEKLRVIDELVDFLTANRLNIAAGNVLTSG